MIWGFIWSPPMPLYDGVLVTETKRSGLDYARVRMWSSVAFIGGTFVGRHRRRPLRPALGALCRHGEHRPAGAARAPAARRRPPVRRGAEHAHAAFRVGDLLRQPPFLLFLMATGLCAASHSVLYSFGTLTWRAAGIDDITISALWAESVAIEIVLMLFGGWLLARVGVCGLIGLGLAAGHGALDRAWPSRRSCWALVLLQALHSCTFAANHLGAMAFLQRALPAHGAAIGQSLYYALGTGATQALVYQFSGLLYAQIRPARLSRHDPGQRRRHGGADRARPHLEGRTAGRPDLARAAAGRHRPDLDQRVALHHVIALVEVDRRVAVRRHQDHLLAQRRAQPCPRARSPRDARRP